MAGISNYLADKINDWLHGDTAAYTPASTTYLALMTIPPTGSGGGIEVTGGGYVRKPVTNNSTSWPASVAGLKTNGVAITWVTPTASWGFVQCIAEYDALTGGNLLTFTMLDTPLSILSAQVFSMPIASLGLRWLGISHYLADRLNDWLRGGGTYTVPSTTYFALMSITPTESAAGTETTGSGYARVTEANDTSDWPNSAGQTKPNGNDLIWGPATGAWTGPEVAVAEFDAATAGNLLTFGALVTHVSVPSGASPTIPAAAASYTVS